MSNQLFKPVYGIYNPQVLAEVKKMQERVIKKLEKFFKIKHSIKYYVYSFEKKSIQEFLKYKFYNVRDFGYTYKNIVIIPLNRNLLTNKINPEIHETVHSFMDIIFDFEGGKNIPLWLYEGTSQILDAYFKIDDQQILDDHRFITTKKIYSYFGSHKDVKQKIIKYYNNFEFYEKYTQGSIEEIKGKLLLYHIYQMDPHFIRYKSFIHNLEKQKKQSNKDICNKLEEIYGKNIKRIFDLLF